MSKQFFCRFVGLVAVLLVCQTVAVAQTVEGDFLRGQGAYLKGLGWYNLNTAKALSTNVDSTIRWKQDLRKIQRERWDRDSQAFAQKVAGRKLKTEEVLQHQLERERQLRVDPTAADVQTGEALNALVYDLTDPGIKQNAWSSKTVPLAEGMSVKDLIFRFTPLSSSSKSSAALSKGVIALSRLDIEGKWPTVVKMEALDGERKSYEKSYEKVRDQILIGEFDLKAVLEMDRSLDALKAKVMTAVPAERGFRAEAAKFVDDLKASTRLFDAETVDYAREILIDTKDHDATTVAELVAFMLKYRLQFATAERSPAARELYAKLYESLQQQAKEFGIKPPEITSPPKPEIPEGAVAFKGKHYKVYTALLTWHEAKDKCEAIGGHLAVVLSKDENNFVSNLAKKEDLDEVYLGATDEAKEGIWVWITGPKMTYNNWGPEQPSNHDSSEHYLTLRLKAKNYGLWNDLPNDHRKIKVGFVCQWD